MLSIDPHEDEDVEAALGVFMNLCKKQDTLKDSNKEKYLSDTLIFLSKKIAEKNDTKVLKDKSILAALDFMHSNFQKKISVSDIAEISHMSYEGFIRKFKAYIGETPYSYLKHLRIRVALRLRNNGISWDEAAEACGCADASTLLHAIGKNV